MSGEYPIWLRARIAAEEMPDTAALEHAAYGQFQQDWSENAEFRDGEVRIHRHPHKANGGRWHTYWHCVTEGEPEESRVTPIVERLERVPWLRDLIENEHSDEVKVWGNVRGRDRHVCIWLERMNYLVVLKQAFNHFLLKTGYCPQKQRRQQLHREYAQWKKTGRAL